LLDVAENRSMEDVVIMQTLTSEDGNGIKAVRSAYLADESNLDPSERMRLLATANHCERLIWLFGEIGRDYAALSEA
jgi:hypothetical protein